MTHGRVWLQRGLISLSVLAAAALFLIFPPGVLAGTGDELNYSAQSTDVAGNNTTEATATTVVSTSAFTVGASECIFITAYVPLGAFSLAPNIVHWVLWNNTAGAISHRWGGSRVEASASKFGPFFLAYRTCPGAGSWTYSLRFFVGSQTFTATCNTTGTGNYGPCFIRVTSACCNDAPDHVIVDSGDITATVGNQPTVKLSQTSTDNAVDINGQPIGIDCVSGCDASSLSGSTGDYLQLSAWGTWFSGGLLLILILAPYFGRAFRFWETT